MIQIDNEEVFGKVIAESLTTVDANSSLNTIEKVRWVNAIAKAAHKIESRGQFMTWQSEKGTLLIWSDSNEIYEANGTCQCLAHMNAQPCWHRAAARIVERYELATDQLEVDAQAARIAARAAMNTAPYLSPSSGKKPETVGGVRI